MAQITCAHCGTAFERPVTEINRNKRVGRQTFCSRYCAGKDVKNISMLASVSHLSGVDISAYAGNQRDEFTGFRDHHRRLFNRNKDVSVSLQDIKDQWDLQKGICPYTNHKLELSAGKSYIHQASLDRVDNNLGYVKGNIEFISLPINYLKSDKLTKEETLAFLKSLKLTGSYCQTHVLT